MNYWMFGALGLGALANLHCLGMCGPLFIGIRTAFLKPYGWMGGLLYHFGRILAYSLLGGLVGAAGQLGSLFFNQQAVAIFTAITGLVLIIISLGKFSTLGQKTLGEFSRKVFAKMKGDAGFQWIVPMGLINGFLPCSVTYLALAGAIQQGSFENGMLFMYLFGMGTLPVFIGIQFFHDRIRLNLNNRVIKSLSVAMVMLVMLRGLNLGIPLISPKLEPVSQEVSCCHKPH